MFTTTASPVSDGKPVTVWTVHYTYRGRPNHRFVRTLDGVRLTLEELAFIGAGDVRVLPEYEG